MEARTKVCILFLSSSRLVSSSAKGGGRSEITQGWHGVLLCTEKIRECNIWSGLGPRNFQKINA